MPDVKFDLARYLRALLTLGRTSNLPTVWSNCLAGWLLGGVGDWNLFLVLGCGATCLYLGGAYLNDAFDTEYDRRHRQERPIPSGTIGEWKVWCYSFMLLGSGMVILRLLGMPTFKLAVALLAVIVVYNAIHKELAPAPVLMGLCRTILLLLAASAARIGPDGLTLWCAIVLGVYVAGLSFVAREEGRPGPLKYWPSILFFAPIVLGLLVNDAQYGKRGLLMAFVLFLWLLGCLITAYGSPRQKAGLATSKLLAGIVLVDLVAVGPAFPQMVVFFPALFILALLLQRFIPAT